jgi:hypothetical protein
VPLSFELGDAFQFDWSEEGLVIGGIYRRLQLAHLKLCASRAFWLVAYPTQGHEMLFDAHTRSFAALGGIPRRGIYDNMKTAVDKVKKGKGRVVNARFAAMSAHYLFDPDFCNVASGWEKGRVEKNVQDSRRRVWIEAARQRFGSFDELNAWLAERVPGAVAGDPASGAQSVQRGRDARARAAAAHAHARALRRLRGEPGARIQHLPGDGAAQPLLGAVRAGRAHGLDTPVPEPCGRGRRRQDRGQPRPSERPGQTSYDWQHYIPLVQRKPGVLRNGAPFADMPAPLLALQQALLRRPGGDRVMAQVLAAVPTAGLDAVLVAAELVLETGAVSAEHVINVIGRLNASPPPDQVQTALRLNEAPRADTDRYDRLRDQAGQEVDHA